jgi:hypothetical protein
MTMTLIETKTLGSDTASLEFTSIPQTYDDLIVMFSFRSNRATFLDIILAQFNGSTSNLSYRTLEGTGSGVSSYTSTEFMAGASTGTSATSNTFGNSQLYLPNYTSSNAKSGSTDAVSENNATSAVQYITASLWNNTAAITSILLKPATGTLLLTGSSASLYGIKKGSSGGVVVS